MARYEVRFKPSALRELRRLPRQAQEQLAPVLDALAEKPRPPGVVKMEGLENTYRVRSGNYRIVYEIHDDTLLVRIVRLRKRSEAYRRR